MHIVDDKMSNQFNIYSCNAKINDVFSMYVISHYATSNFDIEINSY